jgi:FAD/FMN-containing dehydrogenase/Fe-S oxidoreductase
MSVQSNPIAAAQLELELRAHVNGSVHFDKAYRALYATDGSNYRQVPLGVVLPRTADAVVQTIQVCSKHGAPIVSRGGGTALAGQTCNEAVVIDFSRYLDRVLEIDADKKTARVQPGTILDDLRNQAQEKHTLTFGPDPATHSHNTLGGMIGNNSCGIHSVMAGRTVDNIEELEIVTYDGCRMRVGRTSPSELQEILAAGGRRAEIYRQLQTLSTTYAEALREGFPKIPRRVSGYSLDELLPERGFNVARALVGSENTCVTVLEATVKLVYSYPGRALLVLGYPDIFSAADHVMEIMEFKPIGLEGVDNLLVDFMIKKKLHPEDAELLPAGKGWLLVEFGAATDREAADQAKKAMDALKKLSRPPSMKLYADKKEEKQVWEIRESGLGATANVPGVPLGWPGWEDSAVAPEKMGKYLRDFKKLLQKYKLIASLYGHFGQGCLHCRISFDLFTRKGIQNYLHFIDEAADAVVRYGGSLSGEHGDGQSRGRLLSKMYGPKLMNAFREFKEIWDPRGKMNPGKKIDAFAPDQNLRLGTGFRPWRSRTYYRFPADNGSFADATLRCVGVGKCRRIHTAFMCPSFLATRDEKHTTRGRAHLLFEMFHGGFIKDRWRSKEVLEALELCLACKGCKTECPVNVDMATYKSEFLSHYFHRRLRPRIHYGVGLIGYWAPVAAKIPWLVNFFTQTPGIRTFSKIVGQLSVKRSVPAMAPETFTEWFKKRTPESGLKTPVVLYPDSFNDYFYPRALKAAALVLEKAGYRVLLPRGRVPEIGSLIHFGMLALAKWEFQNTFRQLREFLAQGIPIVMAEPNTASVFRHDLHELFPSDYDALRLREQTFLFSEFVEKQQMLLPHMDATALIHTHCHQKATLDSSAFRSMLGRMGIRFEEPWVGCCGMAGPFGLQDTHYDLSQAIGERALLPAVRSAGAEILLIAEGFSCRMQIHDSTGRSVLHSAEVVARGMGITYE